MAGVEIIESMFRDSDLHTPHIAYVLSSREERDSIDTKMFLQIHSPPRVRGSGAGARATAVIDSVGFPVYGQGRPTLGIITLRRGHPLGQIDGPCILGLSFMLGRDRRYLLEGQLTARFMYVYVSAGTSPVLTFHTALKHRPFILLPGRRRAPFVRAMPRRWLTVDHHHMGTVKSRPSRRIGIQGHLANIVPLSQV
jgi:hypothetical protein